MVTADFAGTYVLNNVSFGLDPNVKCKIMYFLVHACPQNRWMKQSQILHVLRSHDVVSTAQFCVLPLPQFGQSQRFFLVNASPPKPLDVAISNVAGSKLT